MNSNRKICQVFNNNPQGSRLKGRWKDRWWNCVETDVNECKMTNWKERSKNIADPHFGTTYWSHLQEDLIYTTAEAWNHAYKIFPLIIMEEHGLKVSWVEGPEKNIWTQAKGNNRRTEKITIWGTF